MVSGTPPYYNTLFYMAFELLLLQDDWVDHWINFSVNHSAIHSVNHWINHWVNHSANYSVKHSGNHSVNQSVNVSGFHSVKGSVNLSVNHSVSLPVNLAVNHSVHQLHQALGWSLSQLLSQPLSQRFTDVAACFNIYSSAKQLNDAVGVSQGVVSVFVCMTLFWNLQFVWCVLTRFDVELAQALTAQSSAQGRSRCLQQVTLVLYCFYFCHARDVWRWFHRRTTSRIMSCLLCLLWRLQR